MLGQGLLIVVEGADGAGKSTQVSLLQERLQKQGFQVVRGKHPHKDTPFGGLIYQYLAGEFGALDALPTELILMLYAIDRYHFKKKYEQDLSEGKIILLDRYIESGLAYQSSIYSGKDKPAFIEWAKAVESRLPQSNAVVYLDLPLNVREELMKKKEDQADDRKYLQKSEKKKDLIEEDKELQERVRRAYLGLAEGNPKWKVLQCAKRGQGEWRLRTVKDIHEEVWERIEGLLEQQKLPQS